MNPGAFEAGNLSHGKARCRETHVDERLDLKAIAPEAPAIIGRQDSRGIESQGRKVLLPEHIEAVAQIGVFGAVEQIDQAGQHPIAEAAQASDVLTAPAPGESRSLGEISSVEKRRHEARDLTGVGGAVGVDHGDNITSGRRPSAGKGITLCQGNPIRPSAATVTASASARHSKSTAYAAGELQCSVLQAIRRAAGVGCYRTILHNLAGSPQQIAVITPFMCESTLRINTLPQQTGVDVPRRFGR
jgi:hypothetical protein